MLKAGDQAPGFALPDSDLHIVDLAQLLGSQRVVLYFYPKDDTPGCTIEALEFTDLEDAFSAANTVVLGVSPDSCVSHGAFRDKHGIAVRLLAVARGETALSYGVWQERMAHGKAVSGLVRSTFIIDRDGTLRHALYDVKPKGHAEEILRLVKEL